MGLWTSQTLQLRTPRSSARRYTLSDSPALCSLPIRPRLSLSLSPRLSLSLSLEL